MQDPNIPSLVEQAAEVVQQWLGSVRPEVGLVLGSGISAEHLDLQDRRELATAEIPNLPQPSVAGHGSCWITGTCSGRAVLIAGGRSHRYEGIPLARATLGIRLLKRLGCGALVVTNAAGGIREGLGPGSFVRIRDHINMLGDSPLVGPHHDSLGARFVDMTQAYDAAWGQRAQGAAHELGLSLEDGVYVACLGPQYETPTEVRMLRGLGADMVGMSTVPEVIVARQEGMQVFGLSLITNAAAGVSDQELSHEEVLETGRDRAVDLGRLLQRVVEVAPTA